MRRDPSDEWPLSVWINDTFVWWVVGGLISLVVTLLATGLLPWLAPLWGLLWGAFLLPGPTEAVLRGLGAWRTARAVAWLGNARWYRSRGSAKPAFLALEALARPDGADEVWARFDRCLRDARVLTPGHLFGMGLHAWRHGRPEEARDLLWLVLYVDTKLRPRPLVTWCTEWLVCEALGRGRFDEVERIRWHPRVAWTFRCRLAVAAARGGAGPWAWVAWWFSPPWWRTRSLLAAARGPVAIPLPSETDPVRALAQAEFSGDEEAVRHAVRLWSSRLHQLPEQVGDRIVALGGAWGGPLAVGDEVEKVLARLVRSHKVALEDGVAETVRSRVLGDLRDEARALSTELQRRTAAKEPLTMPEELVAWCRVLRGFEDLVAVGGREQGPHAFGLVHPSLNNHAVWLHNRRGQQVVANAMYRRAWHIAEALDHPGAELLYNNVDCGPGDGWPRRYD